MVDEVKRKYISVGSIQPRIRSQASTCSLFFGLSSKLSTNWTRKNLALRDTGRPRRRTPAGPHDFFLIISSLFTVCNTRERSIRRTNMSGFRRQRPCPSSMSSVGGAHLSTLPRATISGTRQRVRYRAIFRRVVGAVCGTRQSLCRVLLSLCRVCLAHGKDQLSRSDVLACTCV